MILIVDDKEAIRVMLQFSLKRIGYEVLSAEDGHHALKLWNEHKHKIDLLITDVIMPNNISGKDLADKIRSERPELPVIFCSGYAGNIIDIDTQQTPNNYFLIKPFDLSNFQKVVANALQ